MIAAASVLIPLPVLRHPGWPANDDYLNAFERMEGFRRAFAHGVWYPIWTPFAQTGYGSPYPLFYHRLYSSLGALAALAIGSITPVIKGSVVVMLFLGGAGMRRLLRVSGASEALAVAGALLLIVSPYTRTDWLARGALAEVLGMMLLPWLYAEVTLFLQGQRRWIPIAILLVLLFHAHAMLCYFFLLSSAFLLLATLRPGRRPQVWSGVKTEGRQIAIAGVIVFVFVVPHVIVAQSMLKYFNTVVMTRFPLRLRDNYHAFHRYISDAWVPHPEDQDKLSLELNRFVLIGLATIYVLAGSRERWKWQWRVPLFPFLLIWTLVTIAFQFPELRPILYNLPKGKYLQFPWRLNCFMTIGSIFVLITAVRSLLDSSPQLTKVALTGLAAVVILSIGQFGIIPTPGDDGFTPEFIQNDITHLDGPLAGGEYLLRGMPKLALFGKRRPFVMTDGCNDRIRKLKKFEDGAFELEGNVESPCQISVRQFQTPLLQLDLSNAQLVSTAPSQTFVIDLLPGLSGVRLRQRSFWETFGWVIAHRNDPDFRDLPRAPAPMVPQNAVTPPGPPDTDAVTETR